MSKNDKPTIVERFNYWFDNRMAESFWAKVRLLLIVTIVFVLAIGTIAALSNEGNPGEAFVRTLMYTLGKGGALTLGSDGVSPIYFVMMLLTILYCMFLSGILIGFITNALRSKVDELGKGSTRVLEKRHTLVLGFNDATLELLGELIETNKNQKRRQAVVILGTTDSRQMNDMIKKRFGKQRSHPKTKIICRTGEIYSFDDLKRCSIEESRSIIIDAGNDFETVKAIVACSHVLSSVEKDKKPYMVAVFCRSRNAVEATTAVKNAGLASQLEYLSLTETLARIMVHTSRQPGLSDVFTELFNYSGHEIYLIKKDPAFQRFYGRTIEEINRMLKAAYAIGIRSSDGSIVIDDPRTVTFSDSDSLVVIQEDDDALSAEKEPVPIAIPTEGSETEDTRTVNALILGTKSELNAILSEYGGYLHSGSCIHVADRSIDEKSIASEKTRSLLESRGISLCAHRLNIEKRKDLRKLLKECDPDCVLTLSDHSDDNASSDDERTVRLLLYLREYRKEASKYFSITSEMHEGLNKELASATGPDDFIVGSHISALLMAQISQAREMADVFDTLLSSEGYEIYIKKASWYVETNKELDLYTVSNAVAQRGDIFIGIHHKRVGSYVPARINPAKFESRGRALKRYKFTEDDSFVVLSENGDYSA